jgi:spore germination cell wall hydrolase CwlJ-like protein
MGLFLGATYLMAGMSGHIAERAEAIRMAEVAATGYTGSHLEAQGRGLRKGLAQYGFRAGMDAQIVAIRFGNDRGAAKAMRRADLECMTEAVYYEARGESARGQAAVAQVVMNRVSHPAFPKTVCGVVFQGAGRSGCQFSFTCDGSMKRLRDTDAWERSRSVARRTLAGASGADIGRATHFHTTAVSPFWAPSMLRVAQVGTHIFYKLSPYRVQVAARDVTRAEKVVLISGTAGLATDVNVAPDLVENAIEASLRPTSDMLTKPAPVSAPAPKPTEAAALAAPQSATVSTS